MVQYMDMGISYWSFVISHNVIGPTSVLPYDFQDRQQEPKYLRSYFLTNFGANHSDQKSVQLVRLQVSDSAARVAKLQSYELPPHPISETSAIQSFLCKTWDTSDLFYEFNLQINKNQDRLQNYIQNSSTFRIRTLIQYM